MKRREFAATSLLAALAGFQTAEAAEGAERQILELREYHLLNYGNRELVNQFAEKAFIPALGRLGIGPVGAFTVIYGQNAPSLYLLMPHPNVESVMSLVPRLREDRGFLDAGEELINASLAGPAYVRYESSMMVAFSHMPKVEIPAAIQGKSSRIFELRIYESHSEKAAKKKIEMFNEGGEIAIFKKTGLDPVFFGESIVGRRLPNLAYMLGFESMESRNAAWDAFRADPDWKELSGKEEYKDTVSNISDIILRPASYSQI